MRGSIEHNGLNSIEEDDSTVLYDGPEFNF